MAVFTFIGDEAETGFLGLLFPRDVPVVVTDERAVGKLRNNRFFVESFDGVQVLEAVKTVEQPKKRGRPPKAKP